MVSIVEQQWAVLMMMIAGSVRLQAARLSGLQHAYAHVLHVSSRSL
jgi:hypothetical protein